MNQIVELVKNSNLKQRIAAGLVAAAAAGGYYYTHGTPVSPTVAATSGMHKEQVVKFTVLSGKDFLDGKSKQPKSTVLNDTVDYKQSSLTVYIDRARVPGLNYAQLQGKSITVRGYVTEWKGKDGKSKPEIKVTDASQITIN